MNRKGLYILFFATLQYLLPPQPTNAQLSDQLKKFLWEKDFQTLIRQYAEEHINISDPGDRIKKLRARSFVERPGLRVQVFAGTNQENAQQIAKQIRLLNLDSVYVVRENRLFKVQVGNFLERRQAETMLDRLRFAGIFNAWIVETTIHVPKSRISTPASIQTRTAPSPSRKVIYSIQLFVSGNFDRAQHFQQKVSEVLLDTVWIKQQGNLWKVMAGKYEQEDKARAKLQEIRKAGFTDAWLTQAEIDDESDFR